jgi:hypothetical protein
MGAFMQSGGVVHRPLPPIVAQPRLGDSNQPVATPTCWAASLSSWLKANRNADWSIGDLVNRFAPFCNGGLSLDFANFDEVAQAGFVNMTYDELNTSYLTFEYLYSKLAGSYELTGSYLYIVMEGKNPAHAVVGYGVVKEKETEYIGVMDPMRGVHAREPLSSFRQRATDFLVGSANWN